MKRFVSLIVTLVMLVFFTACGSGLSHGGKRYEQVGLFNQELKSECVVYQINPGNVALSIIFSETVFVPIILIGWHLWEPAYVKKSCN